MDNIKNLINLNLLNILSKIKIKDSNLSKNDISSYVNKNLLNLIENDKDVKKILFNLLNNDGNFLLVNKSLNDIKNFIIKKYYIEVNEEEINNIIILYLESNIL